MGDSREEKGDPFLFTTSPPPPVFHSVMRQRCSAFEENRRPTEAFVVSGRSPVLVFRILTVGPVHV